MSIPTNGYTVQAYPVPAPTNVFLDSALSYLGAPANVFSGLDHLAGQAVTAWVDGNVFPNLVVSVDGVVTLPYNIQGSNVVIGLPYTSIFESMHLEYPAPPGETAQGRKRKIGKIYLRLYDTTGFWIGTDSDHMTQAKVPQSGQFNTSAPLFTGDIFVNPDPRWGTEGQTRIEQRAPLPITVLAVIPDIETSPNG